MAGQANERQNGFMAGWTGWLLRKFRSGLAGVGRPRGERRLELIETLQLGGKRQLLLVLCDGQRVLVGAGGDSVHSIAEMNHPAAAGCAMSGSNEGLRLEQKTRCN
jgi:flagellar biogenesis protein FliO